MINSRGNLGVHAAAQEVYQDTPDTSRMALRGAMKQINKNRFV